MKKSILGVTCACLSLVSFNIGAVVLEGRLPNTPGGTDYQAWYDPDANLTWLADAKVNGPMNWVDANAWAAGLDIDGVTGWRLPDTLLPDASCNIQSGSLSYGHNCTGSEMGNLFYNVLGGTAATSIVTSHNSNYDLFSNLQSNLYWSGTELAILTISAWAFDMNNGFQSYNGKTNNFYGWAVHTGDVSAVPVPATVWLFGSGVIGLIGIARRKVST